MSRKNPILALFERWLPALMSTRSEMVSPQ